MKSINRLVISAAVLLSLPSPFGVLAIEGLKIQVQCPNVVLSWPSVQGEVYIVRYQGNIGTPWTNLTTSLPAASGSTTTFVHANGAPCPQISGGGGPPNTNPPPAPGMSAPTPLSVLATYAASDPFVELDPTTVMSLADHRVFPPFIWDTERREPHLWELEDRPPYPWEPGAVDSNLLASATMNLVPSSGGIGPLGSGGGSSVAAGFYEVVRVGTRLFGFTNGMVLSGQVKLPVEFGNPNTNAVLNQAFLLDGNQEDLQGATFPTLTSGPQNINGVWDTTQATNGQYQIQLGVQLSDGTLYYDRVLNVTVANRIWFPDPCNIGGHAIYIGAQTAHPNGTWHIDIYDDKNNRVGKLDGPIDAAGFCAYPGIAGPGFSLNNTDAQGNQNPSTSYSVAIKAMDVLNTNLFDLATNHVFIEPYWNFSPTYSVLAYMEFFPTWQQGWTDELDMMQAIFSIEDSFHTVMLGNFQVPFLLQLPGDWSQVTNALASPACRDFYYFGHGDNVGLGPNPALGFTIANLGPLLQNNQKNPLTATNMHPFRFVFLDGCNTADGNWPQAFGIPKQEHMQVSDFTAKRGIRPRAFMGWNRKKVVGTGIISGGQMNPDHVKWVTTFWNTWGSRDGNGQPRPIKDAITAANNAAPNAKLGMKLYGAEDLVIDY